MTLSAPDTERSAAGEVETVDAVAVGAGFAGLYMLYELRRQGLTVRVLEAGDDVGGTWYWNRYPGARTDSESYYYAYSFSSELAQDWHWEERYPGQEELLRYLSHVADRFDLRRDISFGVRLTSACYDEDARRWELVTDAGSRLITTYLVTAVGVLSQPNLPPFAGLERFRGAWYHTARWPHEPVDFSGLRVGVVGTGSSGIQAIPRIAAQASQLVVFQRTPNFVVPSQNHATDPAAEAEIKCVSPPATIRTARNAHPWSPGTTRPTTSSTSASSTSARPRSRRSPRPACVPARPPTSSTPSCSQPGSTRSRGPSTGST